MIINQIERNSNIIISGTYGKRIRNILFFDMMDAILHLNTMQRQTLCDEGMFVKFLHKRKKVLHR